MTTTFAQPETSPIRAIWFHPRTAVRSAAAISEKDERLVIFLGMLSGFTSFLPAARDLAWQSWLGVVFLAILGGPVFGFLYLYVGGAILRWTGSWLNGQASSMATRAAIALASLPSITFSLVWLPIGILLGPSLYAMPQSAIAQWMLNAVGALEFGMALWSFVLFLICLSEVHRFSIGKAFVSSALVFVVVLAPRFFCGLFAQAWQVITGLVG